MGESTVTHHLRDEPLTDRAASRQTLHGAAARLRLSLEPVLPQLGPQLIPHSLLLLLLLLPLLDPALVALLLLLLAETAHVSANLAPLCLQLLLTLRKRSGGHNGGRWRGGGGGREGGREGGRWRGGGGGREGGREGGRWRGGGGGREGGGGGGGGGREEGRDSDRSPPVLPLPSHFSFA